MRSLKTIALALCIAAVPFGTAGAAGKVKHAKQIDWSFSGPFGQYDMASAQRGFQIYREVCSACHGLKYFRFRNLADIGYNEPLIKAFAAEYEVPGEVDDFGEPTVRKALPQDVIPDPFPNENAARAANGGALPPDLSLLVKARHDGANYIYSLLTGYGEENVDGVEITPGKSFNPYFKGGQISMAPPLFEGIVEYEDGTAATQDQMAKDIVTFLAYVSEPTLAARHKMGVGVVLFLLFMSVVLYMSKKKIWKPVKEGKTLWSDGDE